MNHIHYEPLNSTDWEFVWQLLNNEKVYDNGTLGYFFPESDLQVKKKLERWITSEHQKHYLIRKVDNI